MDGLKYSFKRAGYEEPICMREKIGFHPIATSLCNKTQNSSLSHAATQFIALEGRAASQYFPNNLKEVDEIERMREIEQI